ncbi:MAG: hypothetical protein ACP5D0_04620 [Hydrogenovibrio sp.]
MDYSAAKTANWLLEHSDLEPIVIEALISEESRPRALSVGDGLFLSLRGVNSPPRSHPGRHDFFAHLGRSTPHYHHTQTPAWLGQRLNTTFA